MIFPEFPEEFEPALPVNFHFEDVELDLPEEQKISDWLLAAAENEGKNLAEITYIFCSDDFLLNMNREYLQHDYFTDVITFPYSETEIQGDIFISTDRVAENAKEIGVSFQHELCRVMIHGLLHLAGYVDTTADLREKMSKKEDFYLSKLNL